MTALIACDLDRTLIYSQRHFGAEDRTCVEIYNESPVSFMTTEAEAGLRALAARVTVLPATTRTVVQYQRIKLPGGPFRYAVTSNGGNILVDSVADAEWSKKMAARISGGGPPLTDIVAALKARISDDWVLNLRVAENLFCYLVVDEASMPANFLDDWAGWCGDRGWTVSRQGRKIYAVPESLRKSHAVAEVRRRLVDEGALPETAPVLAAGDGALDADLLSYADKSIRPAHGELHVLHWQSPRTVVTASSGARAAAEILTWLARQAR